jgi:hypothetical protein
MKTNIPIQFTGQRILKIEITQAKPTFTQEELKAQRQATMRQRQAAPLKADPIQSQGDLFGTPQVDDHGNLKFF